MKLKFTKMHGLGNDFVVFDATRAPIALTREELRRIADRHFGIGCDQILQVEKPREAGTDFYYRIFNADGGEVEQCGNGARCFVRYVRDHGLSGKSEIRVGTLSGVIVPRLEADGQVSVDMGVPQFEPSCIPFQAERRALTYTLEIGAKSVVISALSMGNPHAVQIVHDVDNAPVQTEGAAIEVHPRFPQRVNAGYMQMMSRDHVKLRVFERGAGETLACGTGACAAAVAGIQRGLLDKRVTVTTRGGDLGISWEGDGKPVLMTGPAVTVFEGEMET
ncbi:MAG TPA: diaminopimelate epimerase [Burkholderiales bacterium]|jgi:diaminopimelate epimerase|nr:diaminopimelate epimerase [Burkholderiales bacterium]